MIPLEFFDEAGKLAALRTQLQPHQKRVLKRIQEQRGLVVAHGLGSGKTLSSLAAGQATGALALVPASLQENYLKEQAKHLTGRKRVQVQSLQKAVNTGVVPPTPMLIVDEAHRARNPKSKTYKVLKGIKADKRLLLTASPMYNAPEDVASLVNLAAGDRILPEGTAFRDKFITRPPKGLRAFMPWSQKKEMLVRRGELGASLEKWVDYHASEGGNFPERIDTRVKVPMTRRQTDIHDAAWDRLPWMTRARLRKGLPADKKDLSKINKFQSQARQVTGSEAAFGGSEPTPKVRAAAEDVRKRLDDDPEHKALIYSNYINTLDDYSNELKNKGIPFGTFTGQVTRKEKKKAIDAFNKGKIKALLVSSAGGEGLDLKGTRQVQVLDPHWNDEKIEQVIGRAIRHGSHAHLPPSKRSVHVQRFEATPLSRSVGVEQILIDRSERKRDLKEQLVGLMRKK